ncbi:MAG: zinc dependent phospholipase C family protein, partial [Bacteroidota bacterium]|nr:zinc dependent phospholipase C family protein [Bacteroidota bacterium]
PFLVMPKKWNEAVEKYSEDTLKKYGISPWNIQWMLQKLTKAFQEKDLERILKYSAELGHYIGDAHVPLHTTENYNGQLTNQKGIHGFWESRIPELFYNEYDFITGKAKYIDYPLIDTWNFVEHSFRAVDSVLTFEKQLSNDWPDDKKYAFEKRGQVTMKVYSAEFSKEYSKRLNGMQERRMKASIKSIGSYWFTAWVNAGQPDLSELYIKEHEKKRMKSIEEIEDPRISSEKLQSRLHQN